MKNFSTKDMSRAANRNAALADLTAIATRLGLTIEDQSYPGEREITVHIRHADAFVLIDLHDIGVDCFMAHWNTTLRSTLKFDRHFTQHVNQYHFGKATYTVESWKTFTSHIEDSFKAIQDGSAFQNIAEVA